MIDKRVGDTRVWGAGLLSGIVLWLAFPPCGWAWLGWLAPVPWVWLVTLPELRGRWPYLAAWGASSGFWLVYLQGVRLAHPALYLGWIALSLYVAAYAPLFLALARFAVHRLSVPLAIVAPVVWVGLELVRGYFVGGFSGGMVGNTQAAYPLVIQIADLGGAYLLSFVMLLTASCVVSTAQAWKQVGLKSAPRIIPALLVVSATFGYGQWRLDHSPLTGAGMSGDIEPAALRSKDADKGEVADGNGGRTLHVALIQESMDTIFEYNPERNADAFQKYLSRTELACAEPGPLDVLVWPESMFTENAPEFVVTDGVRDERLESYRSAFEAKSRFVARRIQQASGGAAGPPLIAGTVTIEVDSGGGREYNSALLIDPTGQVADRYYKRHLVMFGEYIPLGDWFPWLYRLAGMPGGLEEGQEDRVFEVRGWRLAPSICFESMVPHRLRAQFVDLSRAGKPPDLLVNLTNDGWFWGSALLDMHLQAGVLRAVELRRPFVVAANTGLSAWIDSDGRVRAVGPRRAGGTIRAVVERDVRTSIYSQVGDWPWGMCALACGLIAVMAIWRRR